MPRARSILIAECLLLFAAVPLLLVFWQWQGRVPFLPVLLLLLGVTLLIGYADASVCFRAGGSRGAFGRELRPILLRAGLVGMFLLLVTRLWWPELLFRLPRERPRLWLLVMLLYPLLSVAPQEYLFRVFFMQRYRPLFGVGWPMLLANALAFGWAHLFFLNPVAPVLSLLAGWWLARTWQRTRSLRAVCLEHALYGQLVFTVGLGWFFYHGSVPVAQ